jgi:hypothetical protein
MKKFSDFAEDNISITGEKIKIDDVLNKELEIINYTIAESKYKKREDDKLLTIMFKLEDEDKILFTGSRVLMEQLEKYKEELPFKAIIKRVNKFYTLS